MVLTHPLKKSFIASLFTANFSVKSRTFVQKFQFPFSVPKTTTARRAPLQKVDSEDL